MSFQIQTSDLKDHQITKEVICFIVVIGIKNPNYSHPEQIYLRKDRKINPNSLELTPCRSNIGFYKVSPEIFLKAKILASLPEKTLITLWGKVKEKINGS